MTLQPGTHLGPYEVLSALGAGGMGEVCRARDTKLNRTVALKVLPELFASDPERLARFRREAQMLAALNHINIAQIYGLEEVPAPSGSGQAATCALVMELVEGATLANRIARGPVPVAEALALARQVGDALQAAHDKGIIHRDLKPANIVVTDDGRVKVLDFGLAKMLEPEDGAERGGNPGSTNSPTLTTPAMMTGVGMILGTAAYMAPEQARGKQVDKRADTWAFGVVLYEMLSGKRLFDGEEVGDTLAGVLKSEPNWTALPSDVPPAICALLKRCLEKDRTKRIGDIAAALFALDETALADTHHAAQKSGSSASRRALWSRAAIVGVAALILGAAIAGSAVWLVRPSARTRVTRTLLTSSGPAALSINGVLPDLTITPDGSRVVYVGAGGTQLFVRALDSLTPVLIATGSFRAPFVSPDGQWVGVEAGVLLERVPTTGSPVLPIVRLDGNSRGAAWMPDHTIIFADGAKGLQRVADAGGMPEFVTHPPDSGVGHFWPEILPGGKAVLFTIDSFGGGDSPQLAVLDLRTGMQRVLLRGGSHAHYVESGHLVYAASGALFAVPFDLSRLETRGTPVPVVQTVGGVANFAVGADGTLVYADAPGGTGGASRTLVWVDRTGKEEPLSAPPRAYTQLRLSPDGSRVAVFSADEDRDIWIWDLRQSALTRLTFDAAADMYPVWTPDSRQIVSGSAREGGVYNLWRLAADGTGTPERLVKSEHVNGPHSFTPDGASIIFEEIVPEMGRDLMRIALDTRRVTPVLRTKFQEIDGQVSPNGRWLAYQTDITGRPEIHVRPYPNADSGHWQVSFDGGTEPLWARSGKELFFRTSDRGVVHVEVDPNATTWNPKPPIKLFDGPYFGSGGFWGYDVSSDAQRFLMIKDSGTKVSSAPPSIIVVQHWDEELKRLVPAAR